MNRAELLEHRRKHFAIEVKPQNIEYYEDELILSITHNGYQWQALGLTREEAERVIKALSTFLEKP